MALLNLTAAAQAAGVNRSTVARALKNGRLSATNNEMGERCIDTAELMRVFGPLKADAQAKAYDLIASQIGKSNAAMLEMLKLIGERNIQITPRVMMVNGNGGTNGNSDAATTALIGTMLDHMVSKDEGEPAATPAKSN